MKRFNIILFLLALVVLTVEAKDLRVAGIFGNNMVLQQKTTTPIWGWADAGAIVTVTSSWNDKSYSVKVGKDGTWRIMLHTPEAGGPYALTITEDKTITFSDVYIGEVWLASGQSNMAMQLKECYEFAKRNEYNVIGEYIDRALTGTTDKRPEFLRMVEDSKKKTFKYVLVYQLDRFARNRYDSATYKAKIKKNGVRVLSAKENITEDASGILVEGVLESMAEYYSVELSQKIRRGIEVSASKCQFFGGSVPLGYYIDEDKHYQIDESKAVFVRKIFEMYADGKTIVEIEKYLLDNKVYNNGKTIGHGTVKRMLHNRRYLGYYIFHDKEVKGGIPQIISDELYETVQARLERNTKAPSSKKAREPFLLTTKLFCGLCNCAMTGVSGTSHTGKKHAYYRYDGRKNGCKQESVQKDLIEETIVQDTLKLLDDKLIDQISQALYEILQGELKNGNVPRLEKLLASNKKASKNLMLLLMDGKAKNTILDKLEQLEKERKEIELQLETEKSEILDYTLEDLRYYVKRFKHLDYTKTENRQALIDTFVNKVLLLR